MISTDAARTARRQVLFTAVTAAFGSIVVLLPGFPFDPRFAWVALTSASIHLALFLIFPDIQVVHLRFLHFFNIFLLGCAIHFSGGIMSPFMLVFVCIIVAGEASGVGHFAVLPSVLATYLLVIGLEFFGALAPLAITPAKVYASGWTTVLIILVSVGFFAFSEMFYRIILARLRSEVAAEQGKSGELIRKMAALESSTNLGSVAVRIAHEVHGSIGAIGSFIESYQARGDIPSRIREDCSVMAREVERVRELNARVLRYAAVPVRREVELCPLAFMDSILAILDYHPKKPGVDFVRDYRVAEPVRIKADKGRLQQVYYNLVKNAIEALDGRPAPRRVTVGISSEGGRCVIRVADNGPGLSSEAAARIQRGEGFTTKTDGSGIGIGIAREFLQEAGGNLRFEDGAGGGATVRTDLPLISAGSRSSS